MKPKFRNNPPTGSRRKAREARAETAERAVFHAAHEAQRVAMNRPDRAGDMPRRLVEREIAEIMLADKEVHTGESFGARPRFDLPFKAFAEWRAPTITGDTGPMRPRSEDAERATGEYVARNASRCAELFRAVIIQISLDRYAGDGGAAWGVPKDDRRAARMFLEGEGGECEAWREELCALAMVSPEWLRRADAEGRLRAFSADAIGKRRYETRLRNAEATAVQPDLFRSAGFAR